MGEASEKALRDRFLAGMSHAAATVYVVTTDGSAGRAGVTVSAMSSVTADPPTILVCVHHLSPAAAAIAENGVFCVNLLRDSQSHVADTFAGRLRTSSGDKFEGVEWLRLATGAPRARDALVAFDCRLSRAEQVGTHHVFYGEVADVHLAEAGMPLLYARRAYGTPLRIDLRHGLGEGGAEIPSLTLGCFSTFGPALLPAIAEEIYEGGEDLDLRVVDGEHRQLLEWLRMGEIELALLYELELGEDFVAEPLVEVTPRIVLPAGHRLADREAISLRDLAPEPLILLEAAPSLRFLLSEFDAMGLKPRIRVRSASLEMVRGMVGRGLGYAILATRPAVDLTYAGHPLEVRPIAEPVATSRIALVRRRDMPLGPTAERVATACRRLFAGPADSVPPPRD